MEQDFHLLILFDGNLIRIGDLLLAGIIVSSSISNLINDLVPSDQVVVNLRLISLTKEEEEEEEIKRNHRRFTGKIKIKFDTTDKYNSGLDQQLHTIPWVRYKFFS